MSHSRVFLPPVVRPDGIAFPSRIEIQPIAAQDLLHVHRDGAEIRLSVSQVAISLAVIRAEVGMTPALARHAAALLTHLADEAERAGA